MNYNPACIISFMRSLPYLRMLLLLILLFFFFLFPVLLQTSQPPLQTTFYIFRFDPPALIEFSEEFQPIKEIPFSIPPNCGLFNTFPAPVGKFMAVELNCPNGQTVLFLDT